MYFIQSMIFLTVREEVCRVVRFAWDVGEKDFRDTEQQEIEQRLTSTTLTFFNLTLQPFPSTTTTFPSTTTTLSLHPQPPLLMVG